MLNSVPGKPTWTYSMKDIYQLPLNKDRETGWTILTRLKRKRKWTARCIFWISIKKYIFLWNGNDLLQRWQWGAAGPEGRVQSWVITGYRLPVSRWDHGWIIPDKLMRLVSSMSDCSFSKIVWKLTFSTANVLITYSASSSVSIRVTLMSSL